MRFSAIHKLSTYLVAATAFLAVVLSGELDPFTILLGTVGLAASWWVEPPAVRIERYNGVYTALSLIALAVAVLTALSGEFLLAGAPAKGVSMDVVSSSASARSTRCICA